MPRKELTGTRDLKFSGWVRAYLPANKFYVSDIDFYMSNYAENVVALIEVKTRMKEYPYSFRRSQKRMYRYFTRCMKLEGTKEVRGPYLVKYSGDDVTTADEIYVNTKKVSLDELIKILSLDHEYHDESLDMGNSNEIVFVPTKK